MDNKTHIHEEQYKELHERLALEIISFFKEKGLPNDAFRFDFTFDSLEDSIKFGEWHPSSDSSITLYDYNENILYYRM